MSKPVEDEAQSFHELLHNYNMEPGMAEDFIYYRLMTRPDKHSGHHSNKFSAYRRKYMEMTPQERGLWMASTAPGLLLKHVDRQIHTLDELCRYYDMTEDTAKKFVYYRYMSNPDEQTNLSKSTFTSYRRKYMEMEPGHRASLIASVAHELLVDPPDNKA